MASASEGQLAAGIERICQTTTGAVALERAVAERLRKAVGFDAWCVLTIDPAAVLPTGGYHDEGVSHDHLPRMVEIEARGEDALALASLARATTRVATLSRATGGKPECSQHFREVLAPSGLAHELRAMFMTGSGPWGALVMLRGGGADFSDYEIALIESSTAPVANAIRREMVLNDIDHSASPDGPGLLLLDSSLAKVDATNSAVYWLGLIDDGIDQRHGLPYSVMTVAHRALADPMAPTRVRTCTRTGRWLTLHAERLAGDTSHISIIIEPTRPVEIAELVADAYGLTPRERQATRLLAASYSRTEIARLLGLSNHTVDDHIKRVFAKLNVSSRAELTAKLFLDRPALSPRPV